MEIHQDDKRRVYYNLKKKLNELRTEFPNDKLFGKNVALLIDHINTLKGNGEKVSINYLENRFLCDKVVELRTKQPNDKSYGSEIASALAERNKLIICCMCNSDIEINLITQWKYGNNPYPYGKTKDDRCCDRCNSQYVLVARLKEFYT